MNTKCRWPRCTEGTIHPNGYFVICTSPCDSSARWWFASTVFPLIAGTFGPIANLFSVCAVAQTWRVKIPPGELDTKGTRVSDPTWLVVLKSISLVFAVIANVLLLLNFGRRVPYRIAMPLTIFCWYISFFFLLVPLCLARSQLMFHPWVGYAFSQSWYYGIISCVIYFVISTLLVLHILGAYVVRAYARSFDILTLPQRTLMLQTMSLILYLSLGAGIFAAVQGWNFNDGLYWALYTLLTIGIGTDFPLTTTLGKALLMPYAVVGIIMVGLIISSIRTLVLERGKIRVVRRGLERQRRKWVKDVQLSGLSFLERKKHEFDTMRRIQMRADRFRRYFAFASSLFASLFLWFMGSLAFWYSEHNYQHWTFFESLYFSYTTLLTIGYGDYYPRSNAGKPFFVVWTLMAVPTVTILISNMEDTIIVTWVKKGAMVIEKTFLPDISTTEPCSHHTDETHDMECRRVEENARDELCRRLGREIARLSRDVGQKKHYDWEDWVEWLALLGDEHAGESTPHALEARAEKGQRRLQVDGDGKADEWSFLWLSDNGPLFSGTSETVWLLEKLCERLETVLQEMSDTSGNDRREATV
ncbi:voltage-gated potassium channel [Fistulina hepatica ATCC 64428]|uniref:Voltage-gated potassium channel n=1 Tax=Fistulina hepatica ATCC 64428 TaxID=1128425 RepID=A0A0D7AHJ1_9AGAR|nr:voltage-gated potassium channel [Fistulina hepatica ATCC 64428]